MKKDKKRKRDYSEYKSESKGVFVMRKCLKCDRSVKLRKQYRMCVRCRESSSIYGMEDHAVIV